MATLQGAGSSDIKKDFVTGVLFPPSDEAYSLEESKGRPVLPERCRLPTRLSHGSGHKAAVT